MSKLDYESSAYNIKIGAKAAQRLSDYWIARGYDVNARVDECGRVVSDLVCGLPKGADPQIATRRLPRC